MREAGAKPRRRSAEAASGTFRGDDDRDRDEQHSNIERRTSNIEIALRANGGLGAANTCQFTKTTRTYRRRAQQDRVKRDSTGCKSEYINHVLLQLCLRDSAPNSSVILAFVTPD
jgi:hypothetical protein